jgi:uncharacterized membrane protein
MKPLIEQNRIGSEKDFRWRGREITRLEALTDAVFAFAVTLLVVSLEVPRTFTDLLVAMKGFAAFAICFAILIQVWYEHYIFSRRYGLQSAYTVFLNSALLFVVLFYVYPLKFLFTLVLDGLLPGQNHIVKIEDAQVPLLMVIYSMGFSAVFGVFGLLFRYAYRKRNELGLNEYEILRTRHAYYGHVAMVILGFVVAITALAVPARRSGLTGMLYNLIAVYHFIAGMVLGKREQLTLERMRAEAQAAGA